MQDKPNIVISTWVPGQIADLIQSIATKERRSRSSVVRNLLLDKFAGQIKSRGVNGEPSDEEEN